MSTHSEILKQQAKEKILDALKLEGYELLNFESAKKPIRVRCPQGHETDVWWVHWKNAHKTGRSGRCGVCLKDQQVQETTEEVRMMFAAEGYELLESVSNKRYSVKMKCPAGHEHKIIPQNFQRLGERCGICAGNQRKTLDFVKEAYNDENYTVLSNSYAHSKQHLLVSCPKGHEHISTYDGFRSGHRCPHVDCNGTPKHTQKEVEEAFASEKYSVSSEYTGNKNPIQATCPENHEFTTNWVSWTRGYRCPHCNASKAEKEIHDFLKEMNIDFKYNDRIELGGKELDFFVPKQRIAIEHCGLYHHSYETLESTGRNGIQYHLQKLEACRSANIRLITIFSDEWQYRKSAVKGFLQNILGSAKTLAARECTTVRIKWSEAAPFLEENHLQGAGSIGDCFALKSGDEIVAVMVFGAHHRQKQPTALLKRYCVKSGVSILGGNRRLFQYSMNELNYSVVETFADRRYSEGNVYAKLGFIPCGVLGPDYSYYKRDKRYSKQSLKKKPSEKLSGLTEYQLRLNEGYGRIYDCGKLKYRWLRP